MSDRLTLCNRKIPNNLKILSFLKEVERNGVCKFITRRIDEVFLILKNKKD